MKSKTKKPETPEQILERFNNRSAELCFLSKRIGGKLEESVWVINGDGEFARIVNRYSGGLMPELDESEIKTQSMLGVFTALKKATAKQAGVSAYIAKPILETLSGSMEDFVEACRDLPTGISTDWNDPDEAVRAT